MTERHKLINKDKSEVGIDAENCVYFSGEEIWRVEKLQNISETEKNQQ